MAYTPVGPFTNDSAVPPIDKTFLDGLENWASTADSDAQTYADAAVSTHDGAGATSHVDKPVMRVATTAVQEVQTVTITGSPTGGTFTLTYSGQTTGTIAFDATAATVQTALEALSNLAVGDVVVTGAAGGPYTCTFAAALGNVVEMTASGAGLTGGTTPSVDVVTTTQGGTTFSAVGSVDIYSIPDAAWPLPSLTGLPDGTLIFRAAS